MLEVMETNHLVETAMERHLKRYHLRLEILSQTQMFHLLQLHLPLLLPQKLIQQRKPLVQPLQQVVIPIFQWNSEFKNLLYPHLKTKMTNKFPQKLELVLKTSHQSPQCQYLQVKSDQSII